MKFVGEITKEQLHAIDDLLASISSIHVTLASISQEGSSLQSTEGTTSSIGSFIHINIENHLYSIMGVNTPLCYNVQVPFLH